MMQSKTVTVSVAAPPAAVYAFASNPENLPRWLAFCRSVARHDNEWVMQTDEGPIALRFVAANPFGVLDHVVTLPSGLEIYNPMRVVANGDGSEVMFTLFHSANMSAAQFADDARLVENDLLTLKRILEAQAGT